MTLTVHFLPGVPEVFKRSFQVCVIFYVHVSYTAYIQIQVAHLQPDEITLVGEGIFPRISFNLPSKLTELSYTEYSQLRETAQQILASSHQVIVS